MKPTKPLEPERLADGRDDGRFIFSSLCAHGNLHLQLFVCETSFWIKPQRNTTRQVFLPSVLSFRITVIRKGKKTLLLKDVLFWTHSTARLKKRGVKVFLVRHWDKWAEHIGLMMLFRAVVHWAVGSKPGRHDGGNWCLSVSVLYWGHLAPCLKQLASLLAQ